MMGEKGYLYVIYGTLPVMKLSLDFHVKSIFIEIRYQIDIGLEHPFVSEIEASGKEAYNHVI
jgi:hypothetical protein